MGNVIPNPAQDKISVEVSWKGEESISIPVQVELFSALGSVISELNDELLVKRSFHLATNNLPNGTYYVRVSSGNQRATKSFVIQR